MYTVAERTTATNEGARRRYDVEIPAYCAFGRVDFITCRQSELYFYSVVYLLEENINTESFFF